MWKKMFDDFEGKTVKGIFEWQNDENIKFTEPAYLIHFEDGAQIIISVPKDNSIIKK